MTSVYFVRHGESEDNVAGLASGAERDASLTDNGRSQARQTGKALRDKQIDLIVCSPMTRAVETAQIIAEQVGYNPKHIIKRDEFIERFMGAYSGKSHAEYRAANLSGNAHASLETTQSMIDRVSKGLDWLDGHTASNIVIVAHGGIGRAVRAVDQGLDHDQLYRMPGFGNAEIYAFNL